MPHEPNPDLSADVECFAMMAPLAVYVTRTRTGAFKDAHISNRPPEGAEVHMRTYDPAEAQTIAARLRLTLAPSFNAEAFRGEKPYHPHTGPNGRPRKLES